MIDKLFNDSQIPMLEKMMRFTQARHRVLAENVVNLNTPNYRPKDLSLKRFQSMLRQQQQGQAVPNGPDDPMTARDVNGNILFHDRSNRSVEQLMADQASNALLYNTMTELMRKKFSAIQEALRERVG
jgi:flagellar basal-body rod protein FlgB